MALSKISYAGKDRPDKAMAVNGIRLEDLVDGYRTIEVTGREPRTETIDTVKIATNDGEYFLRKRMDARTIEVSYALAALTPEDFAQRYNMLNAALNFEQAQLVFADEPGKYFVGTFKGITKTHVSRVAATGKITIICTDPFKYSLSERMVEFVDGVAELYYGGTKEAYPVLEAEMGSTNGFISFTKDAHTLLYGDDTDPGDEDAPAEPDPDALVEYSFTEMPSGTHWTQNDGVLPYVVSETAIGGTLAISGGEALYGATFGSNNGKWHGPTLSYHLEGQKTECELSFHHLVEATANSQCGMMQISLTSASGNVAAVSFWKNGTGSKDGGYDLYVNGSRKKSISYSMAAGNKISGTGGGHSSISKKGSVITFTVAGNVYQYTDTALENVAVTYFTFYFANWKTNTMLNKNRLYSFRFTSPDEGGGTPVVIEHAFHSGDALVADCGSAETTLNNSPNYTIGTVENPWESFSLKPGPNRIELEYSDWATTAPTARIRYREVWI